MDHLQRRRHGANRVRVRFFGIALVGLLPDIGLADTTALLERAQAFARDAAEHAYPTGTVTVRMVPLDPRLRFEPCTDLALDIPGERVVGRVAVQARCRAPVNWGLYLTAQVDVLLPVVQIARPVPRDAVLRPADVTLVPQNLAGIRDGYLIDPADAVGLAARANLRADSVLYQRQLAAPRLVSKGETVTLASTQGPVRVSTQAIALTNGVFGEQIEIRNPRSRRVLTARVTGPGTVSTNP